MEDKEIRAMLADARKGEEVMSAFFDTTPNVLKMNDMEIYNMTVEATGYVPVFTEVAVYLLDYISSLRRLYSDPKLLAAAKKLKMEVRDYEKENAGNS